MKKPNFLRNIDFSAFTNIVDSLITFIANIVVRGNIYIDKKNAGNYTGVVFSRDGLTRFYILQEPDDETGNLRIIRYDNAGSYLSEVLDINRSTATFRVYERMVVGGDDNLTDKMQVSGDIFCTKSVKLGHYTTAQINAIVAPRQGQMLYNTTINNVCFYNGTNWQKVTTTAM